MAQPITAVLTGRFFVTGFLPVFLVAGYVWLLISAGAASGRPDFTAAWHHASSLTIAQIMLALVGVILVAVLLTPLQAGTMRLLQGQLPKPLVEAGRAWQRHLRTRQQAALGRLLAASDDPDHASVQRAGRLSARLLRRYPAEPRELGPTALGNTLAAMEDSAGSQYGYDAVVAWPRLYPVLDPATRAIVDDRRTALDACARLCTAFAVAALVSLGLLADDGPWLTLVLVPSGLAWLSYASAIRSAEAYALAVEVAFDLNRFALYEALHLPLPENAAAERELNRRLCLQWRQGVPADFTYRPPGSP
ncbi:hypothetical protein [Streptomyces sp. NBC_01235]|uniref:hypothetical protein n=1 Tax=Streptomyces sp. NBC_01235 TaxID=2903788 RepID=UPI002E153C01|nr:hypothetical protein OG289_32585 [Streptomyces sp. NBC_01235]